MTITRLKLASAIAIMTTGLCFSTFGQAATIPSSITKFTSKLTDSVFNVRSKGWRDPAFGDMGWTHSSAWGAVHAGKGKIVTIKMASVDAGIHPGITVWFRGKDDTAPDNYVVDHFYPQNANFTEFGASDDTSGDKIGNIIMRHITHGYDWDGNKKVRIMNPIKDDVSGELTISFKAPHPGNYMFVVGGFNPDEGVDTSVAHSINVNVTVSDP